MRKWTVPLTVLGVGGVSAFMFSDHGRKALRWALARLNEAPHRVAEWNDAAQHELERIQNTLNDISESLHANQPAR